MRTLADYTARDVTPELGWSPEAQAQYAAHVEQWQTELHPNGALECYFAAEIVRAAWRMALYAATDQASGLSDEGRALRDRCRERTGLGIRRNLEELRRIQSDRYLQSQTGILLPGVASLRLILPGLKHPGLKHQSQNAEAVPADTPNAKPEPVATVKTTPDPAHVIRTETRLHTHFQDEERQALETLAKREATTAPKPSAPRNAPCPCGSTKKYKHCCGHWSKTTQP